MTTVEEIRRYTFGVLRARDAYREDQRAADGICVQCERPAPGPWRRCARCREARRRGVRK